MSESTRIRVGRGGDSAYDVVVGTGLLGELPDLLGPGVERVLVIHPRSLRATGEVLRDNLGAQGFSTFAAEVPDAEEAKTAEVAAFLWGVLGRSGFTRSDAIVGVGGGTVTDLAGFVAGAASQAACQASSSDGISCRAPWHRRTRLSSILSPRNPTTTGTE